MKRILIIIIGLSIAAGSAGAQQIPLKGEVNLGVSMVLNGNNSGLPIFSVEGLCYAEANEYFHLGAGVGFNSYGVSDPYIIPMFFHGKAILPRDKVSPYMVACNIGYGWSIEGDEQGGLYFAPSAGVQIRLSGRMKLLLGLGITSQKVTSFDTDHVNMLSFRAGLVF